MRLIDADEAKKLIWGIDSCFAEFVDNIPTAYDVEAVVRKLREMDELIIGEDSPSKGIYIRKEHAIAIIKRGGRNE